MVRGSPCMCIRHTAQPLPAAAASAPGSRSARTSLMRPAPAAAAARMTSGLLVSTEMTAEVAARKRSMTGSTRREFLLHAHRLRARPGRLAADIDDGGALLDHAHAVRDALQRVEDSGRRRRRSRG